ISSCHLAMEIGGGHRSLRWAVSELGMLTAGEVWGVPTLSGHSVRSQRDVPLGPVPGRVVAPASLRTQVPGTFLAIDVGSSLGGPVSSFAERLFQLMEARAPELAQTLACGHVLRSVEYSDR